MACKSSSPSARGQLLPDFLCSSAPRPRTHEACLLKRCHKHKKLQWLVSAWSEVGMLRPSRMRSTSPPAGLPLLTCSHCSPLLFHPFSAKSLPPTLWASVSPGTPPLDMALGFQVVSLSSPLSDIHKVITQSVLR